ncbi:hypothetical protein [Shimia haliotis]|uniref:Uncharacterized protein n=1 Tax=Shimia haliotis TaxID=1280847 RepID=A0A1I4CJ40_9RHOB|nr:hypothetical protein [Shimia haliotis]SFK80317.1 hypothetical protein SAMN04488036_102266 [Shimia haliotis]
MKVLQMDFAKGLAGVLLVLCFASASILHAHDEGELSEDTLENDLLAISEPEYFQSRVIEQNRDRLYPDINFYAGYKTVLWGAELQNLELLQNASDRLSASEVMPIVDGQGIAGLSFSLGSSSEEFDLHLQKLVAEYGPPSVETDNAYEWIGVNSTVRLVRSFTSNRLVFRTRQ